MEADLDHIRQQVKRARRWAVATLDPRDRERIEAAAREYEKMAQRLEGEDVPRQLRAPRAQPLL